MEREDNAGATLEDLFKASYSRLVAGVYAFTGDLGEAQDAVQEAFARATAQPARTLGADSPEAYVYTIARNVARGRWRREQRLAERLQLEQARLDGPLPPSPDRVALVRALNKLPAAQREALVRFHFADQSLEEIAAAVGAPVGTIKARLSRGRAALHAMIDETVDDLRPDVAATVDQVRGDVVAAAGSPDLPAAFRRGRQRQLRRRAGLAGGLGAIGAIAASIVILLGFVPARQLPAERLDGVVVSAAGALKMPTVMPVDGRTFFGLVQLKSKRWALANTVDGGQHWTTLQLPDAVNRWAGGAYEPVLLAPRTVLLGPYLTKDGGRHWTMGKLKAGSPSWPVNRVPPPALGLGEPLTAAPAGWPVTVACVDGSCDPMVVDPATGVHHALTGVPPHRTDGDPQNVVRNGNSIWLKTGEAEDYSLDGGRSWSTRPLSSRTTNSFWLAVNGSYVYIVVQPFDGRTTSVMSSLDGGRTWHTATSETATRQSGACALADGTLLMVGTGSDGKVLASHDHGSTFRGASQRLSPGLLRRALDGTCVVEGGDATGVTWWVADSATSYRQIRLPAPGGNTFK
ncbi:sigma-70 family RNA polymerase sigma factor [Fodinicola acaciae]|uniref:sigma-70 family RNA polymerase sigma factor n=1 Tax=Fodinicola acaciae TaxID=2681555 RepID=UPI0013D69085|nr:sigma-70 family RNA polymerase sigma factor [Fodinicola acaciae]